LIFAIDATRATGSPECGDDAFVIEIAGTDLVRRIEFADVAFHAEQQPIV
jgi:hypothetical protein